MFTALKTDNKRISIEKAVSGEIYLCPVCGNPVVVKAVHSKNIRSHFAHKKNSLCLDDWQHDMSDWHFGWQSQFPIENREIVINKDGIVHRADILINGTVIEFQHSPISSEEFEARNSFYKKCGYKVVWLFDVTDKMKFDDSIGLVWKRKNTLFSAMKTPIDGFFIQNYLPESNDLLCLVEPSSKEIRYRETFCLIKQDNFLKEFGVIQDENVLSVQAIFDYTREFLIEKNRRCRELKEKQERAVANAAFNRLLRGGHGRHRRF